MTRDEWKAGGWIIAAIMFLCVCNWIASRLPS